MMQNLAKVAASGQLTRVTFQAVPNLGVPVRTTPINTSSLPEVPTPVAPMTSYSMSKMVPSLELQTRVTSGIGVTTIVRRLHHDMEVPDFTKYRRPSVKDPTAKSMESIDQRHLYTYLYTGALAVTGVYMGKAIVNKFIHNMNPAADVLAMAQIEVNLDEIPEGKNCSFKWRGKPVFVRHRTADEIKQEQSVDPATLRDPQTDSERVIMDEWLVLIGVCTHLGCVPVANAGEFGGYYCPCHGSHYDASGRIRKGPAPLNLEVPHYEINGNILVVG